MIDSGIQANLLNVKMPAARHLYIFSFAGFHFHIQRLHYGCKLIYKFTYLSFGYLTL